MSSHQTPRSLALARSALAALLGLGLGLSPLASANGAAQAAEQAGQGAAADAVARVRGRGPGASMGDPDGASSVVGAEAPAVDTQSGRSHVHARALAAFDTREPSDELSDGIGLAAAPVAPLAASSCDRGAAAPRAPAPTAEAPLASAPKRGPPTG